MNRKYNNIFSGFHRTNHYPLEDTEVFYSGQELADYCKTGPTYNGQRVKLDFEDNDYKRKLIEYLIYNNVPIPRLPNNDIDIFQTSFSGYAEAYLLIHYKDYSKTGRYNKRVLPDFVNISDPFNFSLLYGLEPYKCECRISGTSKSTGYKFRAYIDDVEYSWFQDTLFTETPTSSSSCIGTSKSIKFTEYSTDYGYLPITHNDGSTTYMMSTTKTSGVEKLYICVNDLITNRGGIYLDGCL